MLLACKPKFNLIKYNEIYTKCYPKTEIIPIIYFFINELLVHSYCRKDFFLSNKSHKHEKQKQALHEHAQKTRRVLRNIYDFTGNTQPNFKRITPLHWKVF